MKNCLLLCVAVLALAVGVPASAQYMYLDVNGDGVCTSEDVISGGTTSVDIWLSTNLNGDGSDAFCPTGEPLTVNSYTWILRSSGGITYGSWVDAMGFTTPFATGAAGNDRWLGRGSGTIMDPGTYKLGTQNITVTAGSPVLSIVSNTSAAPSARTSFGSQCVGTLGDNTMRLLVEWNDVCGTATGTDVTKTTWGKIKDLYRAH